MSVNAGEKGGGGTRRKDGARRGRNALVAHTAGASASALAKVRNTDVKPGAETGSQPLGSRVTRPRRETDALGQVDVAAEAVRRGLVQRRLLSRADPASGRQCVSPEPS